MKYFNIIVLYTVSLFLWSCSTEHFANKGNRFFDQMAYAKAIEKYEKALDRGGKDWEIQRKLGDSYRLINDPINAVRVYEKALAAQHDKVYDLHFAQTLMEVGRYQDAMEYFEAYRERGGDEQIAANLTSACSDVLGLGRDRGIFELVHTNINSEQADFGPMIHDGQLFFSTGRDQNENHYRWDDSYFLDLYAAKYDGSAQLGQPEALGGNINSNFHESNLTFTPKGDRIFFTRNNISSGRLGFSDDKVVKLKLFEVERRGERWIEKGEFPFNSDNFSVGHPALSKDGNVLVFASDMPGGVGGVDLYYSRWDGEKWVKPMNLGSKINTTGDEMFPWIGEEGLFFASSGQPGLGGLDIFKVEVDRDLVPSGSVENLGTPINSRYDDFQIVMDTEQRIGFFSSNRIGGKGDDDILAFIIHQPFKGEITDESSGIALNNVRVIMEDLNGKRYENLTDEEGHFFQGVKNKKVQVYLEREGYEPVTRTLDLDLHNLNDPVLLTMKAKAPCGDGTLTLNGTILEGGNLKPGTLVKIEQKEVYVESDANGNFKVPLNPGFEYTVSIQEPGLVDEVVRNVDTRGLPFNSEVDVELAYELRDSSTPFYIIYYNYDRSEIRQGDARPQLDRLVEYMKRKSNIQVKLSSHTDSRGASNYNLKLSQQRAKEAMDYITSHGISIERLGYSFHGEEILTNDCEDGAPCTEDEHQKNRRTELRIAK